MRKARDNRQRALWSETPPADDVRGMVHRHDPPTSAAAAVGVKRTRTALHARIEAIFEARGDMTDAELETLPEFSNYGPSTIRKRRSELAQEGRLVDSGTTRRNARGCQMVVWRLNRP